MALIHQFQRMTMTVATQLVIRGYIPTGTWIIEHLELGAVSSTGSASVQISVMREGNATKLRDGSVDANFPMANNVSWDGQITVEYGDVIVANITNGTAGDVYELDTFMRRVA